MSRLAIIAAVLLTFAAGCGQTSGDSTPPETPTSTTFDLSCQDQLELTVVPRTIWGTPLPSYTLTHDGQTITAPLTLSVSGKQSLQIKLSAPEFVDESVTLTFDGTVGAQSVTVSGLSLDASKQVARRFHEVQRDGRRCPGYTVVIGLDHRWFAASGRPARPGNRLTFFSEGESMWSAVYDDLRQATRSVHLTSWWWESNFELRRPEGHEMMSESERAVYTIGHVLDSLSDVDVKVLICQFAQSVAEGLAYLNTDRFLRDRARDPNDRFEAMVQPNHVALQPDEVYPLLSPRWQLSQRLQGLNDFADWSFVGQSVLTQGLENGVPVASFHQKLVVVDGRVAYITGMNIKSTDWDDSRHLVYNPRRMKFPSSDTERQRVAKQLLLPDLGPRKDYGIRVAGPIAQDVEDVFRKRWELGRSEGDLFSDATTPLTKRPYDGPSDGTITAQVVATMPAPIAEVSIFESHLKAVRQAKHYIYIEDQYFRAPMLNEAILAQMEREPTLHLIVVTKPVSDADGGKKYTVIGDAEFRKRFPERYLMLQLKSFVRVKADPVELREAHVLFQPIDVHSKIMIIDDRYLSLGSCNKNNRGYKYEGELNIAVLDDAFVTDARRRVVSHLLGEPSSDDTAAFFAQLKQAATYNDGVDAYWQSHSPVNAPEMAPRGFVYSLSFTPDYLLDVGPDFF